MLARASVANADTVAKSVRAKRNQPQPPTKRQKGAIENGKNAKRARQESGRLPTNQSGNQSGEETQQEDVKQQSTVPVLRGKK